VCDESERDESARAEPNKQKRMSSLHSVNYQCLTELGSRAGKPNSVTENDAVAQYPKTLSVVGAPDSFTNVVTGETFLTLAFGGIHRKCTLD
jgi:hypothetical protein